MKKLYINYYPSKNFGDALNLTLTKLILKKLKKNYRVVRYDGMTRVFRRKNPEDPVYLSIGSILSWANKDNVVWGPGFIKEGEKTSGIPKKILAVRGPLTRQRLLDQGLDCPEVYGDPALLLPKFYFPKVKKKYKLGLIPHYVDKDTAFLNKIRENRHILIIDINNKMQRVVKDILSCEKIASSSLHGVIVSDAYNIPSIWLEFSNKVLGKGFKFRDYFLSVKRQDQEPLVVTDETTLKDVEDKFEKYNNPTIDLKKLIKACPFNSLK